MPIITKPLLAGTFDADKARYPYLATPKIDGIRFLMIDGVAVSRSFKLIRNQHIQKILSSLIPNGFDGELTSGKTFQDSTSAVMTIEGTPEFTIWLFDYVDPSRKEIKPYHERLCDLTDIVEKMKCPASVTIIPLKPRQIRNEDELVQYEQMCLSEGYEGVMLRDPNGTYKFGRSSTNENILLKVKKFVDDEAVIVSLEEKRNNMNEATLDNFGNIKRSSSQSGLVDANTLGTIVVKNFKGHVFGIGSGLTDEMRDEIWKNKSRYIGKMVKYKHFPQGVKECPRHPVFVGFRDEDDM